LKAQIQLSIKTYNTLILKSTIVQSGTWGYIFNGETNPHTTLHLILFRNVKQINT